MDVNPRQSCAFTGLPGTHRIWKICLLLLFQNDVFSPWCGRERLKILGQVPRKPQRSRISGRGISRVCVSNVLNIFLDIRSSSQMHIHRVIGTVPYHCSLACSSPVFSSQLFCIPFLKPSLKHFRLFGNMKLGI